MEKHIPDDITSEERAALAKLRSDKRIREAMEPWLEQRRCQQWGIPYDAEMPAPHREQLAMRDAFQREMFAQHTRNWRWLGAAWRVVGKGSASIGEKAWNGLVGGLVLLGLGWLATKLGFKIPGVP